MRFFSSTLADSSKVTGSQPKSARFGNFHSYGIPSFGVMPWEGLYEGHTVTYVSMQLAYYLGYKTVLLVGVDHRYAVDGEANKQVTSETPDESHFSPAYFGPGFTWNLPDLERSELAYRMARTRFEADGRRIINLTEGTALSVFEVDTIEAWL